MAWGGGARGRGPWVRQPHVFLEHANGSSSLGGHLHRQNTQQLQAVCAWTHHWLHLVIIWCLPGWSG